MGLLPVDRARRAILIVSLRGFRNALEAEHQPVPAVLVALLGDVDGMADIGHKVASRGAVPDDEPDMVTSTHLASVAQAATHAGVPARTIRRWARAGQVRVIGSGRVRLVDLLSLAERANRRAS